MENKEIVEQTINAFLNQDIEKALSFMTEDVKMGWPGFFNLEPGKAAIRDFFKEVPKIIDSKLDGFIEEDNIVSGWGSVKAKHPDGTEKNSFFCDLYILDSGKIKEIKSFMVFEQTKEPK